MTGDYLARVAAIAEREQTKADARRREMRAQYPSFASFIDQMRASALGEKCAHAVTVGDQRYGPAPLPFRRDGRPQPKVPGI